MSSTLAEETSRSSLRRRAPDHMTMTEGTETDKDELRCVDPGFACTYSTYAKTTTRQIMSYHLSDPNLEKVRLFGVCAKVPWSATSAAASGQLRALTPRRGRERERPDIQGP